MKKLVSIIIPTKNEERNIGLCLKSIKEQTYKNTEIIVVDNNSLDKTKEISKQYTDKVFNKGPERSSQRNFGAEKAKGDYLLFIDADMIVTKKVIEDCIELVSQSGLGGVIIPEESFGHNFWARCKKLERSFYLNVDWIEAPRFFPKKIFNSVKGYDETLVSGEDWDLGQKVREKFKVGRIKSFIMHNEGNISLFNLLKKKFYYSRQIKNYALKNKNSKSFSVQSNPINRYKLFLSNPKKLFADPLLGIGMLFMKTSEFFVGAVGILFSR